MDVSFLGPNFMFLMVSTRDIAQSIMIIFFLVLVRFRQRLLVFDIII